MNVDPGQIAAMRAEVAALAAEVDALRNVAAEVAVMRDVVDLFYEAGRADALHLPPRPARPRGNLTLVRARQPGEGES